MFGIGLFEVALLLCVPLAVVLVARAAAHPEPTRARESWSVLLVRAAGLAGGLAVATWLVLEDELGRGLMLAPVAVGTGLLLGVALGEAMVRPVAHAGVRTAALTPRRVLDHAPRALTLVVGGTVVVSAATLAFTSLTASADDLGRDGRVLARTCTADQADLFMSAARGPYPGSYYSVPLAIGLLVAVALAVVTARRVVLRPRGSGSASDDVLRRRAVTAVVAALGVAVAAPLAGTALITASALGGHDCPAPGWDALAIVMGGVVLASVVTVGWCLLALLVPGTSLRRRTAEAVR